MQAERDEINHAAVLEAPACMPVDLAKMRPKLFLDDIMTPCLARVRLFFSADGVASIDQDHRDLQQNEFQRRLVFFRQGALLTAAPFMFGNGVRVREDYLEGGVRLKWEKDEFRMNLLDLSLEGIFQAKQFKLLGLLDPNPVPQADDDDDDDT
ncbi:hypothetical protein DYB28_002477 [Aphanomyces astaci]|uniref:Uncharacterized protein n=1 Tax=Aphanomyces astaci TaxID=112090 RepID=A0A9X8E162_APHAT|nr:hypothetical protein DYB28_002477 [Aphanomyces astaci]